jgi:hypothetical protein
MAADFAIEIGGVGGDTGVLEDEGLRSSLKHDQ